MERFAPSHDCSESVQRISISQPAAPPGLRTGRDGALIRRPGVSTRTGQSMICRCPFGTPYPAYSTEARDKRGLGSQVTWGSLFFITASGGGGPQCGRPEAASASGVVEPNRDVLRESAGRCAGLPSGECGTSSGRVRYVLRESAVRPAGECGTFCGSQTFCSSLLEQRKLEVNDLRPACKQDWTGSGCNIKGAGGFC
ncbi:hypothetical protein Bbelb_056720 [Branchiostoma belcheri]|nr:hypothetical protein Bbelb_056720 [Branchiostoma belcheri]